MLCAGIKCRTYSINIPWDTPGVVKVPQKCQECPTPCHSPSVLRKFVNTLEGRGFRITTTRLLYCLREEYYKTTYAWFANIEDMWLLFQGQLAHAVVEGSWKEKESMAAEGKLIEAQLRKEFIYDGLDFAVTGRADYMEPGKLILDYKTIKIEKFTKMFRTIPSAQSYARKFLDHYEKQLNIYNVLAPEPVEKLQIAWLTGEGEFLSGNEYYFGQFPKETKKWLERDYGPEVQVMKFLVPPMKLLDHQEIYSYIQERGYMLAKAFQEGQAPPKVDYMKFPWKCNNCIFRERCGTE